MPRSATAPSPSPTYEASSPLRKRGERLTALSAEANSSPANGPTPFSRRRAAFPWDIPAGAARRSPPAADRGPVERPEGE